MNIKTSDFDEKFDEVEDITTSLDFDKAHRPGLRAKRVNVDFPQWMSKSLDKEAHVPCAQHQEHRFYQQVYVLIGDKPTKLKPYPNRIFTLLC